MPLKARHANHIRIGIRLARLDIRAIEAGYRNELELDSFPPLARRAYFRAMATYARKLRHPNCRCTVAPAITVGVSVAEADRMLRAAAAAGAVYVNGMP